MKKRINTIDGKILVQGGTDNELKSNEIRVNADKTLTERVNGEIVNAGGAKIVPYTKDITIKDKTIDELIPLSVDEEGYYNYGAELPSLYMDVIVTDAKVFIGEVRMIGWENVDSISKVDIVPSYVDENTNISITAGSYNAGGGSPVIKFKLVEIV